MTAKESEERGAGNRTCQQENNRSACANRKFLNARDVLAINVMAAPGAGKTSLIERSIKALKTNPRCDCNAAVIAGDFATDLDFRRFTQAGVPCVQINTGCSAHLDAHSVRDALHRIDFADIDILFIENVGNLVCPANFDLGHHQSVAILSVPEGHDLPLKFSPMFRAADLVLVSKCDLLEHIDEFDQLQAERNIQSLGNNAPVIPVSSHGNDFFGLWINWLINIHEARREGADMRPKIHNDGLVLHAAE